jgi:Na+/melibiose symporter-like transporter
METQNYSNHTRFVKSYHYVLGGILILTLFGSLVNLYQSLGDHQRQYSASLIVVMMIAMCMIAFFSRIFALKAQDRAIRVEENLRHYVLTGKLLDSRVTTRQVVGLRFASDEEFLDLAQKAAEENLSEGEIKRAVKNWRADTYRV